MPPDWPAALLVLSKPTLQMPCDDLIERCSLRPPTGITLLWSLSPRDGRCPLAWTLLAGRDHGDARLSEVPHSESGYRGHQGQRTVADHHRTHDQPAHHEPVHSPSHQHSDNPTRTLRRQQAPHHHGRRETLVHVAGGSKDPRPEKHLANRAHWAPGFTENHDLMYLTLTLFGEQYRGGHLITSCQNLVMKKAERRFLRTS